MEVAKKILLSFFISNISFISLRMSNERKKGVGVGRWELGGVGGGEP